MEIHQIDPTKDARWTAFVERHPRASIFHTQGWLQALRHTYGYETVAFTTSPPTGELQNGLVFCHVDSWLTGRRLVSLPFSDHCEPLCDSAEELNFLVRFLQCAAERHGWKYLEIRPIDESFTRTDETGRFVVASRYFLHSLSLCPELDQLFRGFDRDSVQRRIGRAEGAGLEEKCGRSEELLRAFYSLFILTRRRHHLPPTPYTWFQNLIKYLGDAFEIRIAYKEGIPVSSILTLRFKDTLYYKYGCSDVRFKSLGATPWLLWRAIAAAKNHGATMFDLGRTEEANSGLRVFKNHWDPRPRHLLYWRFPDDQSPDALGRWKKRVAKGAFSVMPLGLLKVAGRLLYRHIG